MSDLSPPEARPQASHLWPQQFTNLPGEGKTSQSAALQPGCHRAPPDMAQGCHLALKGTTAPESLGHSSVPGHVGVDKQVSGSLECPLGGRQ